MLLIAGPAAIASGQGVELPPGGRLGGGTAHGVDVPPSGFTSVIA